MGESYKTTILVVDDQSSMRRVIEQHLRAAGYSAIYQAESGEEALERLGRMKMDLVILDWTMPGMSGIDVLREIRSNEAWKNTKVMMVTAEGLKENVIAAVQAGANSYVVKPFTQATLLGKIEDALPLRRGAVNKRPPPGFMGSLRD